ncbi:MAG: TonB-dependent receptor, partial [Acidobacteriia bacterium]|nr:TonB-dependent receptor [Terriglobia bacterium]
MAIRILLLVSLLGFGSQVSAQLDRASLVGTVSDSSGALVPGAKVEVVSPDTGLRREALTSESGTYTFSFMPIGPYTVTVSKSGFRTVTTKDLRLGVGDNRTLDIAMELSNVETSVTVESVLAPMDSTSAVVGTVIGGQHMREIPLNGRHWASLMALAPGAINTGEGNQQSIRFVGRARDDNNWTFDGLDATGVKDPRQEAALRLVISTDSIAEFRVNSTLYSADSGSGAGAQVNIVSKSGTNEFHGSIFEFFRNDKMDARNPFDTSKQPFRLNQFGGSVGGPIVKNRTFFFANYEGLRQRVSSTLRNDVPSAAFRARATIPAVRQVVDAYPSGTERTSNADVDRAVANVSQSWQEDSGTLRVDHRFNDNNTFFARYNIDDGTILAPRSVIAGDREESFFRPSNFVMQFQRVFSPTVVNETKAGFNRSALNRFSFAPFKESIAVAQFTTLNNSNLLVETGTSYSLIDNLAINRGRHTLKIGGEIRRAHVNVADPAFDNIGVTYTNLANLLLNRVDRVAIGGGDPVLGTRKWYYYAYVQDDIKVNPELTLNLGLRYEFYGVNREVNDRYRVFDLNACRGFCPHGTPWYFPDRNNFDPRVGLAWSPKALEGKTVIRTGVGIYHGPGQIDDQNAALDNVSDNFSLTSAEAPGLSFPVAPFLAQARAVGLTPRSLQRDRRDLYSAQWGLSIQQQLPASFITQIGYVGSSASKVTTRKYINNLDPVTKVRPLPTFGRMDEKNNDGNSNFNALQGSLHRRVARGLTWGTE